MARTIKRKIGKKKTLKKMRSARKTRRVNRKKGGGPKQIREEFDRLFDKNFSKFEQINKFKYFFKNKKDHTVINSFDVDDILIRAELFDMFIEFLKIKNEENEKSSTYTEGDNLIKFVEKNHGILIDPSNLSSDSSIDSSISQPDSSIDSSISQLDSSIGSSISQPHSSIGSSTGSLIDSTKEQLSRHMANRIIGIL